jgi:hypothetical protein
MTTTIVNPEIESLVKIGQDENLGWCGDSWVGLTDLERIAKETVKMWDKNQKVIFHCSDVQIDGSTNIERYENSISLYKAMKQAKALYVAYDYVSIS